MIPHMVSIVMCTCTPVGYRDFVCLKGINVLHVGGSICFVPVLIKFKLESWL